MNTEKLETAAVGKFTELIDSCDHLKAQFSTNDKTRIVDGRVEIFESSKHKNTTYETSVEVQIKGRSVKKECQTYQITRTEIESYLKNRGILLLVGFKVGSQAAIQPYYSILRPGKIEMILKKFKPGQNKKSIELRRFPHSPEKIESIMNFAKRMKSEVTFASLNETLLEGSEGISLLSAEPLDLRHPVSLSGAKDDFYIEVRTRMGVTVSVVADIEIVPEPYNLHEAGYAVSCGAVTYANVQRRQIDENTTEIKISEGIAMHFRHGEEDVDVITTSQSNLSDRLKDVEFLYAMRTGCSIRFGEQTMGAAIADLSSDDEICIERKFLQFLDETLVQLGVDTTLVDLSKITDKQSRQMRRLYNCLILGEPAREKATKPGRIRQPLAGMTLELLYCKDPEDADWRYEGLTNPESGVYMSEASTENGEVRFVQVTPYDLIPRNRFATTLNLRLDRIVDEYERIEDADDAVWLANRMVLDLLQAADENGGRKGEFLDGARRLNDWLISGNSESHTNLINRLQIIIRERRLLREERDEIRKIRRECKQGSEADEFTLLSCAILLGDNEEVSYLSSQLSSERSEVFMSYPIWNLHNTVAPD